MTTTLYYPVRRFSRWFWCKVEGQAVPVDSCDPTLHECVGHETPEHCVRHHADYVCRKSTVIEHIADEEMRPCDRCFNWTTHYYVLSLDPYQDRVFVCKDHCKAVIVECLRKNHFKWRGIADRDWRNGVNTVTQPFKMAIHG